MNAYEIEQLEKQMRAGNRLTLPYEAWADIARLARQERARFVGKITTDFLAGALAMIAGVARQMRRTAADCTDARLRHDH